MPRMLAVLAGLVVLGAANWTIYARERLLTDGRVVLLALAPADPRSLMQGDYMALNFQMGSGVQACARGGADGRVIARVDERGVATFERCDDGRPLDRDEVALRYRIRGEQAKFATNAFFFQEGQAKRYVTARFGEARVAPSGDLLLTGLRDEHLRPLGPAPPDD